MKSLIIILILLVGMDSMAQNVGIGTSAPQHKLDVNGVVRLRHTDSTAGFWLQGTLGNNRSFWGMEDANSVGIYGTGGGNWALTHDVVTHKTGIGTPSPQYHLDVNGRVRIRHTPSSLAGFTLTGSNTFQKSYTGTMDDNYFGIYGLSSASWLTVMNVNTGFMGLGTTAPTAKLDVNGDVMIRGGNPKKGSVLVCSNSSGDATWQDPIGFEATGIKNTYNDIPVGVWTKLEYGTTVNYNTGNGYNSNDYIFTAPVAGIYEFQVNYGTDIDSRADTVFMRILHQHFGVNTEVLRFDYNQMRTNYINTQTQPPSLATITRCAMLNYTTGGIKLAAGDKIWVEMFVDGNVYRNTFNSTVLVLEENQCKFSGSLMAKL